MAFWVLAAILAVMVSAILALAPSRRLAAEAEASDVDIYRDQLAEVDRDLARGVINPAEAERTRIEVSRRLLEASRTARTSAAGRGKTGLVTGGVIGLATLAGAVAVYLQIGAPGYPDLPLADRLAAANEAFVNRPSQEEVEATLPAQTNPDADPRLVDLVAQLRAAVANRPAEEQGLEYLARYEAQLGNFGAAWRAQSQLVALRGGAEGAPVSDLEMLLELMVIAAQGYVSPEAQGVIGAILERENRNGYAMYYSGLMLADAGRADLAFPYWRALLEQSSPDAPWLAAVRSQIERMAAEAGVDYTLPPAAGLPGPSAEDVAAAGEMSAEDQQAMIQGMVAQLGERLATEGGTADEWARLIRALGVLGETGRAQEIFVEAREIFAESPSDLAQITAAARDAELLQ